MHTPSVAVDTYSSSHACPIDGSSVAYVAFEIPPPRALRGRERRERREAHEVRLNPRKKRKDVERWTPDVLQLFLEIRAGRSVHEKAGVYNGCE